MLDIKLVSFSPHDTIQITLGDESYTIDLYYYCGDNTFLENEHGFAKELLNFLSMLENWKIKYKKSTNK